jgi:PAS domain S-box-containing protein
VRSVLRQPRHAPPAEFATAALEELGEPVACCHGGSVIFNRRARELHGLPSGPQPAAEWTARGLPLDRALRGERVRDVLFELSGDNGEPRILSARGGPVHDDRGQVVGATLVIHEESARHRLERERRLGSAIAAGIGEGLALVQADDGELVYTNEEWDRMLGYRRGELLGQPISVVNAPSEQTPEDWAREMIGTLEREGTWRGDVHAVRKDGEWFWCAATISAFDDPEHGPVWAIVQTETTGRKARQDSLHEAEERYRTVFQESPVGIALVGNDQRLTAANRAFCELVGLRREELVGRPLTSITHPDDLELGAELAVQAFSGEILSYRVEKRYVTKRGDSVPVAVTASVVCSPDGSPRYAITIAEEIPAA